VEAGAAVNGTTVSVNVHVRGDDPFTALPIADGDPSAIAAIEVGCRALLVLKTPAQADSLIRAAVAAKDMLLAATAPAVTR
jgi:hypothetical protein